MVVEIDLRRVIVVTAIGRKFYAFACAVMTAVAATVMCCNVLTARAMAENNGEHTATTCHQINGKN